MTFWTVFGINAAIIMNSVSLLIVTYRFNKALKYIYLKISQLNKSNDIIEVEKLIETMKRG